jgi:serine/threonine protein kinase
VLALALAPKMISAVEKFHRLGYIHRDINPSSLKVKDGEVYLKNFANVIKYVDDDGKHIEEIFGKFVG